MIWKDSPDPETEAKSYLKELLKRPNPFDPIDLISQEKKGKLREFLGIEIEQKGKNIRLINSEEYSGLKRNIILDSFIGKIVKGLMPDFPENYEWNYAGNSLIFKVDVGKAAEVQEADKAPIMISSITKTITIGTMSQEDGENQIFDFLLKCLDYIENSQDTSDIEKIILDIEKKILRLIWKGPDLESNLSKIIAKIIGESGQSFKIAAALKQGIPELYSQISQENPDLRMDQLAQADSWGF
jgi:hypothetical protein